jgi:cellulose synthase/poly-beta-1,6-N-acetylglucosamine synthase-like glycosyltransferase
MFPPVALVICALNEEGVIREKIENSLQLEYPEGKLAIVVVSDGSIDRTAEIINDYRHRGVQLIEHETRRGKVTNLNEVIPARCEEIVVLSDANVMYRTDAIARLVARFKDPSVGCVSGRVILTNTTPDLNGPTSQYYSVEWRMQEDSSAVSSMMGADGAMYALRRELFRRCPSDTLIEDFVIPMQVIAQGSRVVMEPEAIGWEEGVQSVREEFRRKVRIAAGAAQGLLRGNVLPKNAPLSCWIIFVSHKLLRWLSPLTASLIAIAAAASLGNAMARVTLAGMAFIATLAAVAAVTGWRHAFLSAPFYFVFGQVALAIGLVKGLAGRQTVLWAKANR